jgi:hypothetical protein
MSRKILTTLLVCLFSTFVGGLGSLHAAEPNEPEIYVEKLVHDFGRVFQQETFSHTFVIRNKGKADLVIKEVKPG